MSPHVVAAPAVAEPPRVTSWKSLRRRIAFADWSVPLYLFVFSRIALMTCSYMGLTLVPHLYLHEDDRHKALQPYPAIDGLCRWDCGWFERVMHQGFREAEHAKVFPLYGWLANGLSRVAHINDLLALIIIANVAGFASYVLIFRIFTRLADRRAAAMALTLYVAFPFAYYQTAAYAESLMAMFSALAILLALDRRHLWAGVALGLGIMSRHVTIFAGAAMLVAQIHQRWGDWKTWGAWKKLVFDRNVFGLVIPFLFVGAWSLYLKRETGDPLAFWNARTIGWGPAVFWSVRELLQHSKFTDSPEFYFYVPFALIPGLGALALLVRRSWMELAAAAIVLMVVCYASGGVCLGRYSAACWPAFLPMGYFLSRRRGRDLAMPVIVAFAICQGLFFYLFSHQFRIL
jgi:Dolichyl-phosphate-mannose-protein mannosyltransferase